MFHGVCLSGSILGPLLFVIYINDFTQSINLCKVVLYADDTTLLFADKDPDIITHRLETDHESPQHWFNCHQLNLNVFKCKWMMFGTVQRLRHTKATDLFIGENPLEKVRNYKYLGMWLDVNFDWHYHIDVMRSEISSRIGVLKRIKTYLTEDITTKLHNAMVLPLLDY